MESDTVITHTRRWIEEVVIGWNLCPFARKPFSAGRIRFTVTPVTEPEELRAVLGQELRLLAETPPEQIETTLLIHPSALSDFLDYNDFAGDAEELLSELDLDGVIQIATFHPDYRFAGTAPDAVENYTNRSPYPMLHLLREASITAVADDPEFLEKIPERNIETLRRLGKNGVLERLRRIHKK